MAPIAKHNGTDNNSLGPAIQNIIFNVTLNQSHYLPSLHIQ